tara:strand:- start:292 stop:537 length:246 start_codon:yes stop_codon:yes gene_type:complete
MTYKAQLVPSSSIGGFTGSINKIYAYETTNLITVGFGNHTDPYTSSAVIGNGTNIAIPVGSYFEGPIVQFSSSKDVIVYTN